MTGSADSYGQEGSEVETSATTPAQYGEFNLYFSWL